MQTLREKVADLEQEEFFEMALTRQSLVSEEPDPDDIDVIMQGMLGPTPSTTKHSNRPKGNASSINRMNQRTNHVREDSGATAVPLNNSMTAQTNHR